MTDETRPANADLHAAFAGVFTALVTPFRRGEVDFEALGRLIDRQIAAGVRGLVPVGTTGEAATLSPEEAGAVIRFCVERSAGRAFVLAGAGSNATEKAIHAAQAAAEAGADGLLVVTPYYNRPSQEGLRLHYGRIAEAVSLPIMLYSVPGRTGVEISPATAGALARSHANIVGIKEAGGRCERIGALREACGTDFIIHSGDDGLTLPFLSLGAIGVTSVVSNYAPEAMVALCRAWQAGDTAQALSLHEALRPLFDGFFVESNPGPVKAALAETGAIAAEMRLPLAEPGLDGMAALRDALARFGATGAASLQKNAQDRQNP